ncbi:uncharacterized protein LOC111003211 [Pieris rapae]|uniref:uncharacterized protein LOC111003211 n=1 Tax=Pieris rapae TaxID=64459 RepID=UPI001E27BB44|nr:uncharacterized protein LOC111003211 [Pieris rapae]
MTEEMNKQGLRDLIARRTSAKGQITKFKNYLNSIACLMELDNVQLTELDLKLTKFEALSIKVDDLQSEIEVLNYENISAEIEERDKIEQDIILNIAKAKTLVEKFSKKLECEKRCSSGHNASCCIDDPNHPHEFGLKLPQIQIAKFDGAYFRWLEFKDTFENLIHNNDRIPPINKFHYLISYLQGDAARVISNFEVSAENYVGAWDLLCSRYNNKRILINHHLNLILSSFLENLSYAGVCVGRLFNLRWEISQNSGLPQITLFLAVGVDYAGPFLILNRKGRGSRLIKCYLCIFVCLRFKCIHLEAISELTKEAYIMALRRCIARRGKPTEIFSDNGTNFVAAARELGSFMKQNKDFIFDFASQNSIIFHFIPAYTPHFGGIWESGVKSAKHHIRRVMRNCHLTFEEILTLFAQVEAILNSRPLCPLSSSPDDLLTLSPGHFLIGRPLTSVPSIGLDECKFGNLQRYQRIEQLRQHFWRRWQKEYVAELQQRTKWKENSANLNIGDLVLIAEDNAAPLCWKLGRVQRLIYGLDGVARVSNIKNRTTPYHPQSDGMVERFNQTLERHLAKLVDSQQKDWDKQWRKRK